MMIPVDSLTAAGGNHSNLVTQLLTGAVAFIVAGAKVLDHRKGKVRDTGRTSELKELKETLVANHLETTQQFGAVSREMLELRSFIVGPDGENGLRGDVRDLKEKVEGLVDRERENLQRKAFGGLDRRAGT